MDRPFISLLTDYGTRDGFVAVCHGVILSSVPHAHIVDITHEVSPGDIASAAVILAQTVPYLPVGVHIGVVDPGVGTNRLPIAIETERGTLVGPDNGLLIAATDALGGARQAVALTDERHHRAPVSHTFHGRDIFAPVAAAIATGLPFTELGTPIAATDLVRLPTPEWRMSGGHMIATAIGVDRFGNIQLAAPGSALAELTERLRIGTHLATRGTTFASVPINELVVLCDSADHVAIAERGGSATETLNIRVGDVIRVETVDEISPAN